MGRDSWPGAFHRVSQVVLFVVLGGVLVAEGRADVEAAYYNSSLYYFDVTDVPDLISAGPGCPATAVNTVCPPRR